MERVCRWDSVCTLTLALHMAESMCCLSASQAPKCRHHLQIWRLSVTAALPYFGAPRLWDEAHVGAMVLNIRGTFVGAATPQQVLGIRRSTPQNQKVWVLCGNCCRGTFGTSWRIFRTICLKCRGHFKMSLVFLALLT